jgi:hypothetical protein
MAAPDIFQDIGAAEQLAAVLPQVLAEVKTVLADLQLVLNHVNTIVALVDAASKPK